MRSRLTRRVANPRWDLVSEESECHNQRRELMKWGSSQFKVVGSNFSIIAYVRTRNFRANPRVAPQCSLHVWQFMINTVNLMSRFLQEKAHSVAKFPQTDAQHMETDDILAWVLIGVLLMTWWHVPRRQIILSSCIESYPALLKRAILKPKPIKATALVP